MAPVKISKFKIENFSKIKFKTLPLISVYLLNINGTISAILQIFFLNVFRTFILNWPMKTLYLFIKFVSKKTPLYVFYIFFINCFYFDRKRINVCEKIIPLSQYFLKINFTKYLMQYFLQFSKKHSLVVI